VESGTLAALLLLPDLLLPPLETGKSNTLNPSETRKRCKTDSYWSESEGKYGVESRN
jgi:hypothetical protein